MTSTPRPCSIRAPKPACGPSLTDHEFVACVDRTATTETWESRAPNGRRWLVKVLFGVAGPGADREDAVRRLQGLRHPNLVPARVLPGNPGCLVVAAEAPAATLLDHLQQFQAQGAPGIPRPLLLGWLRTAAETLDDVWQRHGVAHLALTPRRLVFAGDRLLIADHGLAQLTWLPTGQFANEVRSRYAAPEASDPRLVDSVCDQFSLAAIFQELLTGVAPFPTWTVGAPDLAPLPEPDRAVVARALDADPEKRFPCCVAFVDALERVKRKPRAEPPPLPAIAPSSRLGHIRAQPARAEPPPVPALALSSRPGHTPAQPARAEPPPLPAIAAPGPDPATVTPPSAPAAREVPLIIVSYASGPMPGPYGLPSMAGGAVREDTAALDEVFVRAAARMRQMPLLSLPAGVGHPGE